MGTVSVIPEESETSDVAGNGSSNPDVTKASGRTQNRYTIVNADDSIEQKPYLSALEEKNQLKANLADDELRPSGSSSGASGSGPGPAGGGRQLKKGWLNAEQEKMKQQQQSKRYEEAKRVAVATQEAAKAELEATGQPVPESGTVMIPSSATPEPSSVISPSPGPVSVPLHTPSPAPAVSPGPQLQSVLQSPAPAQTPVLAPAPQASSQGSSPAPSTQPHWPTAEEEKHRRLFNEAQDRARRAQAAALLQTSSPSPSPLSQANVAALENAYQPPNAVQSPMAGPAPVATPPAPSPPPAAMYVPAPAAQPAAMYVPTPAAQPAAMYAPNTVPPPAAMYAPAPAPIPAPVPAPAPVVAPAPIPTPPVMFQPSPQPAPAALPPAMNVIRQDPGRITPQQQAPGFKRSAGAELYQNAMMMARGAPGQSPSKPALQNVIRPAQSSSPTPSANAAVMGGPVPAASGQQQWQGGYPGAVPQQNFVNAGGSSSGVPSSRRPQLSAEAEKAQLRYLEAKRAVDRRQRDEAGPEQSDPNAAGPAPTQPPQNAPLPYEMLFPGAANGPATAPVQQVPMQQPPMQMRSPVQPQSAPPIGMVASNAPMNPAVGMHRRTMSNGSSMSASEDGVRRQMNPLEAIASLSRNTEGGSAPSPPPRRQTPGIMSPMSPMATGNTFSGSSGFAPSPRPPSYNPPPGAAGGSGFTSPQQPPVRDAYRPPQAPLTAEQEKAQLAARYRQANESPMGGGSSSSQPAPPPPAQGSPPPFDAMPPSVPGGAPAYGGGTSALSATEEKARLAAAYAAEERGTQNANQTPGYGAPPPADAYGYQAPPPVGQFPPAAEWNTPPPMSPPQQTQQMYQSPPPQAYAQLPPQQQQQQQYPAQAPYSQPQPPYGQPQALYQGMHAAQPQIGAGTPSPPIAAPQATRPAMPTNFESQGSMGGGSVSNGYANAQSPAPTGGYQQPQYQQSPPQQYESGYLYQDQQTNPANGNGNGYHEQQPYPQNGNGVNNGWSDPSSYGQYPQQQQQYPSSALDRDPAVRQGKQRASQLLPQQQYDYYPHDEHDPDATFVPPPLAPRPPAEYIQETQRVAAATDNHRWEEENMMHYDPNALGGGLGTAGSQGSQFGLEVRPFSPLDLSFDRPPPPPPPPRVHI
ncbi:hypothetical protein DL93DRAFT_559120 [Clavulina sp. PMI_390]|nr:hypothetical protein DL93DRAFT_559120 [Clavulina sp. PMI_390]